MERLGCLPHSRPFEWGDDLHPFACPHPNEISLELSDHGECVEQQPANWVGGVVYGPADAELDLAGGELVGDGSGVGHRAGESVELRDDKGVAGAAGR